MVATDLRWDRGALGCFKSPLSDHLTMSPKRVRQPVQLLGFKPSATRTGYQGPGFEPRARPTWLLLLLFCLAASGLSIHQLDFPDPSFWTRTNLEWSDKLWRIEFWKIIKILCILLFFIFEKTYPSHFWSYFLASQAGARPGTRDGATLIVIWDTTLG